MLSAAMEGHGRINRILQQSEDEGLNLSLESESEEVKGDNPEQAHVVDINILSGEDGEDSDSINVD